MSFATTLRKQGLYDAQFEHDACGIGFVVNVNGRKSHDVLRKALEMVRNMAHRGASTGEDGTGDGAGVLIQIPHAFFARVCAESNISLPGDGQYGVGMLFLPADQAVRRDFERRFEEIVVREGQTVLGWRTVPTRPAVLGSTARACMPAIRQVFIGRGPAAGDSRAFERRLYVIRKAAEKAIRHSGLEAGKSFYVVSLSARTIVYKGMLTPAQLAEFYPDLSDPAVSTALALVHSRFSTNTFPSWERAHPYRLLAHNGEINTLRGNVNWMRAREPLISSELYGEDLAKVLPVVDTEGSDSAMFDNCLEFLVHGGYSLPHAVAMMIPEPWENHESMPDDKKAFYEYHSCLMEPWDGPTSMIFTDGVRVGAVLDRNGLRPSRYCVTRDGMVVLASEAGALEIPPEMVAAMGRVQPGRMLLVDTSEGRIVQDEEIKRSLASQRPYREWLTENLVELDDLPDSASGQAEPASDHEDGLPTPMLDPAREALPVPSARGDEVSAPPRRREGRASLLQLQKAFGYTSEDLRLILAPMASEGSEPIGAMGNDAPLAVLSDKPQLLYNYFKQLFAQVTNPPIDAIREEIVVGVKTTIGPEGNLLEPGPESCRQVRLSSPILTNQQLDKLRDLSERGLRSVTLPILFRRSEGPKGLEKAIDELCRAADDAIASGASILILSDRGVDAERVPIPALLAASGVHHHLIRMGTRMKVGLVVESGEPREVHHIALLLGYGAGAVNPYLAFDTLKDMVQGGVLQGVGYEEAASNYSKALLKGIVKVISKMGISTIQSYRGAQVFEAIGLSQAVIDRYFAGTPSRVGGIGLEIIAEESLMRHDMAFAGPSAASAPLDSRCDCQWRRGGEFNLFSPEAVRKLQAACRTGDERAYREYSELVGPGKREFCTLRDLLDFRFASEPIPVDEVEPVESIVKRFKTGAMSFGSISKEAHETIAIAMNRLGAKSNSGEGGEDPARYVPDPNGDSRSSAIKQVASGRFGVTSEYLVHAEEIQIKIAQGAKPGEGGHLPGHKVYPWVAKVRHSTPGVGLISPPPHHDIYSIEDLAQLIYDLRNVNPRARVNVKLVSAAGVGTVAAGVAKSKADVVAISGYDGGTGAAPLSSIRHAGLPWELGVAETHQTLVLSGLRSRIAIETDGKLMTGRDVAIAALLGAEEFAFSTAPLVALGCIMCRRCHTDTCPAGIATQNPELRKKYTGRPEHVVNLMTFIARELREIMARLGFRTVDEMIGRTDKLVQRTTDHWKARWVDLSALLYRPSMSGEVPRQGRQAAGCEPGGAISGGVQARTQGRTRQAVAHELGGTLDESVLLGLCRPAFESGKPVEAELSIRNTNRAVGTMLGGEVTRRHGSRGLAEDTIRLRFKGSAGQSFGAFIPPGITLHLEGDANDYVGKGLSGGKIIVVPPQEAAFAQGESVLIGNAAFYGATSGEAYIRGMAGERFCVRNSGVRAVVEGVGDHGCEYMTGGRVVVLGPTGRNFGAGMSGGIAYVWDPSGDFVPRCNRDMVLIERVEDDEEARELRTMIERHAIYTGSRRAAEILAGWEEALHRFAKVIPKDYKRMLEVLRDARDAGAKGEGDEAMALERAGHDLARVG